MANRKTTTVVLVTLLLFFTPTQDIKGTCFGFQVTTFCCVPIFWPLSKAPIIPESPYLRPISNGNT